MADVKEKSTETAAPAKETVESAPATPAAPAAAGTSSDAGKAAEPTVAPSTTLEQPTGPIEHPAPPVAAAVLPPQHWTQTVRLAPPPRTRLMIAAAAAAAAVEPEHENDDADSTFSSVPSDLTSITSSILKYRTVHGRTYHSEAVGNASYWAANDEQQNEAMDINHHVQTLAQGDKLYLAPVEIEKIQKVVDIGCGTGIWAIDFADLCPNAEVIGTDISPIQPTWVPPNLSFQIDDCDSPWTFADNSLDYVHIRFLMGSVTDWNALFAEAYRCLKPGGWLESHEPSPYIQSDDGTVEPDSAMAQWAHFFIKSGVKSGRSFTVVEDNTQNTAMEAAGFETPHVRMFKSPIGSWPADPKHKEIGMYAQLVMESDLEGLVLFVASVHDNWSREEVAVYVSHLRREIRSGKKHAWYWQKTVWARKPL
ncbi:S-adenosyl-L-methionine-dependent methyltransferase [Xylariomycetidae sp. FL2044]|nr:S-adenosyl-L-methionine-dependent methyltransferase [Xylariomycetidae sp. FL2044]